jgi:hypothetical protein
VTALVSWQLIAVSCLPVAWKTLAIFKHVFCLLQLDLAFRRLLACGLICDHQGLTMNAPAAKRIYKTVVVP